MDALERSHLLHDLTGKVWLSQNSAYGKLVQQADAEDDAGLDPDPLAARGQI